MCVSHKLPILNAPLRRQALQNVMSHSRMGKPRRLPVLNRFLGMGITHTEKSKTSRNQ